MTRAAFTFHAAGIRWSAFGTLTFKQEVSPERARRALEAFWKWVAYVIRIRYSRFVAFGGCERGEQGHRLHLHTLIHLRPGVFDRYFASVDGSFVSAAVNQWRRLGLSAWRRVEGLADSAVGCALKGVPSERGAHECEFNEFRTADDVWMSDGLFKVCAALIRLSAAADTIKPPSQPRIALLGAKA